MRLVFQIAFAVLAGIGALYAGISNFISPAYVLDSFYGVSAADLGAQAELAVSSQLDFSQACGLLLAYSPSLPFETSNVTVVRFA
jgi:hypothetical protein